MKDINDSDKWKQFCRRLLKKTEAGEIEWVDWSDVISRPDRRSPLFVALHKRWRILIYSAAYKYFHDEEQYELLDDVFMELIDERGKNEWTIPKVPSRTRLLDYVQFQNADVESLLGDILTDEEDEDKV